MIASRYHTVTLTADQLVSSPGERISHLYLPLEGCLLLSVGRDRRDTLGVGLVGRDGLVGAARVLGIEHSLVRVSVQQDGSALRLSAAAFAECLSACPVFAGRARAAFHQEINLITHTAACAVFHVVEVRLAYWLLMVQDCLGRASFTLTHDRLARMLGVRRSGVTTAAGRLQHRSLISYRRGHIEILDRAGLERVSCDCFRSVRSSRRGTTIAPRMPRIAATGTQRC